MRTSARGPALFGFRHRRRRLLVGRDYSLPRFSHVFSQNTRENNGLVGYSICNCRICMGIRVSNTTKHVHTKIGAVLDNRVRDS